VVVKYGEYEGGWTLNLVRSTNGMGVWKAIRIGWDSFLSYIKLCVDDWRRVSFCMMYDVFTQEAWTCLKA